MIFSKFAARALSNPSGILGRALLPRMWNRRNAALNDFVMEKLDLRPDDRALDVGCGGGYLLERMSAVIDGSRLAGVDRSQDMIRFCEKRFHSKIFDNKMVFQCASAEKIPFPEESFDKISTVNMIFYVSDLPRALGEMHRVLRPGGRLAVCFTRREDFAKKDFARHGLKTFEVPEIIELMSSAKFRGHRAWSGEDRWRRFYCVIGEK
jgi:arsenite methyltransferase